MKTIDDVFDPARNSLNAIRLLLAATVIVSHSWLVNGLGLPPMVGGTDPGLVAVAGFFAISGYLVTSSRLRSSTLRSYLWRRFLRIYPAFIVALVIVAFVLAPLSTLIDPSSEVDWGSAGLYVLSNAGLFLRQVTVEHTLINNAFPFVWNVPLWTLFYEAICYLIVGVLVSFVPRRMLGVALVALLAVCTALSMSFHLWPGFMISPILENLASLGSFFCAGALLYIYRTRVPSSGLLTAAAVVLALLLATLGLFKPLAAVAMAYVVLYAGSRLPLTRVGRRNDVSYGMYIYGFPIQQLLILVLGGAVLPVWLFAAVAVVATVPFAWLSWLALEKPALRIGRRRRALDSIRVAP
ncbi:Peptidoglycan/LPS O-acetylase OafA/YrhL, contains acyltransferase and SGNH-hydrolase domains [Agreia bicolorata]|uniref:Peptidoglycan/LPS O-acetylase OafA/YrhL, contains acyltransferase and SGNH-hydrolase domains n=1 Tax=Agreia bicolorata TaxID=110935 RepID=A0A1T4WXT1_9MICO|nr:acyltransferase [Agreia bicolorata]SKA82172.1 Peptidoglycan/LPS O-acetylase OafA/YrhL, contains acyltransferase and SGNH-hydrolase domains [Agreia bicolorata]